MSDSVQKALADVPRRTAPSSPSGCGDQGVVLLSPGGVALRGDVGSEGPGLGEVHRVRGRGSEDRTRPRFLVGAGAVLEAPCTEGTRVQGRALCWCPRAAEQSVPNQLAVTIDVHLFDSTLGSGSQESGCWLGRAPCEVSGEGRALLCPASVAQVFMARGASLRSLPLSSRGVLLSLSSRGVLPSLSSRGRLIKDWRSH